MLIQLLDTIYDTNTATYIIYDAKTAFLHFLQCQKQLCILYDTDTAVTVFAIHIFSLHTLVVTSTRQ